MSKVTLPEYWIEYAKKFREKHGIKPKENNKAENKEAQKKRTKPNAFKRPDIMIYVYEYYLKELKKIRWFNSIRECAYRMGLSESTVSRHSKYEDIVNRRYLFSRTLIPDDEVIRRFEEKLKKHR